MERYNNINLCDYIAEYQAKTGSDPSLYGIPIEGWSGVIFDLTIGNDVHKDQRLMANALRMPILATAVVSCLDYMVNNPRSPHIVPDFQRRLSAQQQNRIAMMFVHGDTEEDQWFSFEDGDPASPVQDWIDFQSVDGYDLLIVGACNPSGFLPTSSGIPLLYARGIAGCFEEHTTHLLH